ncbi:unnamed protein product [Sphagnum balticum]
MISSTVAGREQRAVRRPLFLRPMESESSILAHHARAERDPKISKSVLSRLLQIVRPQVGDLSIPIGYPGAKT